MMAPAIPATQPAGEAGIALDRWIQPKSFAEPLTAPHDADGAIRLTGQDGVILAPPRPIAPGELVYTGIGVRPTDLYGVGGNAGLVFLDKNGSGIQQGLSSERSFSSVIRWAPVEYPLHWSTHWYEFETVRVAPPGAAAVSVYLQFWKTDSRWYPNAANEVHLRAPNLAPLKPMASPGGSR
jgi:hypothetical protein